MLPLRGLQQRPPRGHIRTLAQDRPALTLGHPAPDAPLDLVVQRLGEALGAHRAPPAQLLGLVLRRALHEQLVGPAGAALGQRCPVLGPRRRSHRLSPCGDLLSQTGAEKLSTDILSKNKGSMTDPQGANPRSPTGLHLTTE